MSAEMLLRVVYAANVLVAGYVGIVTLFWPRASEVLVFSGGAVASPGLRVAGALWTAIAVASAMGIVWPRALVGVLVIQLIYKGLWLVVVAVPAVMQKPWPAQFPWPMAGFFLVWVLALPWVIQWGDLR